MADKFITWTSPGACACCGGGVACVCAMFIPVGSPFPPSSPYANYSDASTAVNDPLQVASCVAYFYPESAFTLTSTATVGSNMLTMNQTFSIFSQSYMWASVNLTNGETLSAAYSGTLIDPDPLDPGGAVFNVYDCAGNLVHTDFTLSTASGTFTYVIPSDDAYTVLVYFAGNFGGTAGWTDAQAILSATTLTVNPVIALWDDSGTTRQLWACPKLELPPLTESTGTWYANSGAASTAISTLTSNCVGYIESMTNVTTFTATDGGATLTLAEALTASATSCPTVWGGVNAINAATLTFTLTVGAGTAKVTVNIYDDTGTLVQASGLQSSPWISSGLPYKGRYTFSVAMSSTSSTTSYSLVVSSSSAMTVNPVQALWDNGLACPSWTNC